MSGLETCQNCCLERISSELGLRAEMDPLKEDTCNFR